MRNGKEILIIILPGVLYLIFQIIGAGIAGGLLRGSFGTVEKSIKYTF